MQSRHQYNLHDLVAVGSHPNYHNSALRNNPGLLDQESWYLQLWSQSGYMYQILLVASFFLSQILGMCTCWFQLELSLQQFRAFDAPKSRAYLGSLYLPWHVYSW